MSDVNVALGLVAKHFLEQTVASNGSTTTEAALSSTESTFPTCVSVKDDLEKGFRFWEALVMGLQPVRESGSISETTYAMFVEANEWLQQRKRFWNALDRAEINWQRRRRSSDCCLLPSAWSHIINSTRESHGNQSKRVLGPDQNFQRRGTDIQGFGKLNKVCGRETSADEADWSERL